MYNEDLILRALKNEGYPESEARSFANDGCWEIQIPGKTDFAYMPFDALQVFNRVLGVDSDGPVPAYPSAEALYQAFLEELKQTVEQLYQSHVSRRFRCTNGTLARPPGGRLAVLGRQPVSRMAASRTRRSYFALGPVYTRPLPHIGGAPDVANSLYALQKAVFEEKRLSLRDMVTLLRGNWEGAEAQRLYRKPTMYITATIPTRRTLGIPVCLTTLPPSSGGAGGRGLPRFIPGGQHLRPPDRLAAQPERHRLWLPAGDILSGNDSPTPGTDSAGASHHPILLQGGFENNLRRR